VRRAPVLNEEVLTGPSTGHPPWCVVPADRRWIRDVAAATLLVQTFRALGPSRPRYACLVEPFVGADWPMVRVIDHN
jgi:hypothetical protein